MSTGAIIAIACISAIAVVTGIVLIYGETHKKKHTKGDDIHRFYDQVLGQEMENVFDASYREELRNRGRLQFEKIMRENTVFLQQDLRLTSVQLNEYIKTEVTKKLNEEFLKYEQAVGDAKQVAIDYIQKTNGALQGYQQTLDDHIKKEIEVSKQELVKRFEDNMTKIVGHYIQTTIGDNIDLGSQLDSILADFEANKTAIIEDITNGS